MKILSMFLFLVYAIPCFGQDFDIVKNGIPTAAIVTAPDAAKQTLDAAKLLALYIEKSTGAKIPVNVSGADAGAATIHVGTDSYVRGRGLGLEKMDGDGFVIASPEPGHIVIAGPTDWGTEFGVYEFLERSVGVRWLMPGKWGEDVPKMRTIRVPRAEIRQEPAYFSRQLSMPNGDEFARRNRHHARVSFHHWLLALFPPSRYTKTHPEFFPIWDGKRYLPSKDDDFMWQPCFSAPGIVEEAAKNIKEYFRANPQATSYSLGMNDTDHFCQCEKCLARENPQKNFLGYRNYSDLYFDWANRVVEEVLKEYPDKWFGTLAYWCLAEPPKTVKVHPQIIPYMTYGRIRWFDPELEKEGHRLTEWWKSMSPTLGWYDYIYGTPYILPRVFFHQMADYLRYGVKAGVRVSYAEIYYNWGEGPKEYLALKLQWNPDIDVDKTLDDWYERAVGKAAAPDLKAYYSLWEKFWTRRIRSSAWYSKEGQWMRFNDPGYLDIVTADDLATSRRLLESVVRKADTEARKKRAGYLLRAFEYYEASAKSLQTEQKAYGSPPVTEKDALGLLDSAGRYMEEKETRWRFIAESESDPVLRLPLKPDEYWRMAGDRWGCRPLWAAYEWVKKPGSAARKRFDRLSAEAKGTFAGHLNLMRGIMEGTARPLSVNAAFGKDVSVWEIASGRKRAEWTGAEGHTAPGALKILIPGSVVCGQRVTVPAVGGTYLCVGFVKAAGTGGKPAAADIRVSIDNADEDVEWLPKSTFGMTTTTVAPGRWVPVTAAIDVPADEKGKGTRQVVFRFGLRDVPSGTAAYLDDFGIWKIR